LYNVLVCHLSGLEIENKYQQMVLNNPDLRIKDLVAACPHIKALLTPKTEESVVTSTVCRQARHGQWPLKDTCQGTKVFHVSINALPDLKPCGFVAQLAVTQVDNLAIPRTRNIIKLIGTDVAKTTAKFIQT
jgi:hypothetical protein